MYAEERQQAIADLVAQRGRLSVNALAAEYAVTTETVRRDLSVLERAGILRRVHGGAVPAAALTALEAKVGDRDLAHADEKDRIAKRAVSPAPRHRRQRAARRRHHDRPAGDDAPPRPAADGGHQRGPDRRPARRLPQRRPAPAARPGPARPPTPPSARTRSRRSAVLRADVAFVGTNGLSAAHGLSTPDHAEAAAKRAMVARRPPGGRARRLLQDRPGAHGPLRRPRRHRRGGHRRRHRATPTGPTLEAHDVEVVIA